MLADEFACMASPPMCFSVKTCHVPSGQAASFCFQDYVMLLSAGFAAVCFCICLCTISLYERWSHEPSLIDWGMTTRARSARIWVRSKLVQDILVVYCEEESAQAVSGRVCAQHRYIRIAIRRQTCHRPSNDLQ